MANALVRSSDIHSGTTVRTSGLAMNILTSQWLKDMRLRVNGLPTNLFAGCLRRKNTQANLQEALVSAGLRKVERHSRWSFPECFTRNISVHLPEPRRKQQIGRE